MKKGLGSFISLLVLLSLVISGCTTIKGKTQKVKIATDPEGAEVYFDGKLLGRTPGFIEIPRQKEATIILKKQGRAPIEKKLETSYRWGDSFFSNFIWFIYGAPVGWVVDYTNGTAWDYDKLGLITFSGRKEYEALKPPRLIAIAPPQTSYELLSNEVAERIFGLSHSRFNSSTIKDFDETHNLFAEYGYTNEEATGPNFRDDLFRELGATHIIESDVKKEGKDVVIKSKLVDVFTDKEIESFTDKIPSESLRYSEPNVWSKTFNYLVGVVPNTVTFDLSSPGASLYTSDGYTFTGEGQTTYTALSILSGIGFKSLDSPKFQRGISGVFKFIPIISASYDRFSLTATSGPNITSNYNFDWVTVLGGFGPELGLDTAIGYFYFEIAPALSSNWITASGNALQSTSARGTSLTLFTELGYQIFASSRINLRLFTRYESVPTDTWSQILTQLRGAQTTVTGAGRTAAGLSIGYYFPEDRIILKRAFFPY